MSPNNVCFHSAPLYLYSSITSPAIDSMIAGPLMLEPKLNFAENSTSTDYNFEFEAYQGIESSIRRYTDLPLMSFADELFQDGQVLPLRLPPRLQNVSSGKSSRQSSRSNSPTMGSIIKSPFARRSSKSKDFDPFVAALEQIRKEETMGRDRGSPRRRARSLSPLRSLNWYVRPVGGVVHGDKEVGTLEPIANPSLDIKWHGEHKRLAPMKAMGRTRSHLEVPMCSTLTTPAISTDPSTTKVGGSGRSSSCRSFIKRKGIKQFLFKSDSEGRGDNSVTVGQSENVKDGRCKFVHGPSCKTRNAMFGDVRKKTMAPYRQGLLICFGFSL